MYTIIGIDCATKPNKVGLALASIHGDCLVVEDVALGNQRIAPAAIVVQWLKEREPVLLALDAPLGWPSALGHALSEHHAGQAHTADPDHMFHRLTDTEIRNRLGQRPLEVGANLIARTAHAALALLDDLRSRTKRDIPLAWNSSRLEGIASIEVYPAATLAARGERNRPDVLDLFDARLLWLPETPILHQSQDARDAVLCAIAGFDFLAGTCVAPTDSQLAVAEREGWIWARSAIETKTGAAAEDSIR